MQSPHARRTAPGTWIGSRGRRPAGSPQNRAYPRALKLLSRTITQGLLGLLVSRLRVTEHQKRRYTPIRVLCHGLVRVGAARAER
eukprot:6271029-Prymnesium_polylepis.1